MAKTGKKIRSVALCTSVALMAGTLVASQILPVLTGIGGDRASAGSADAPLIKQYSEQMVDAIDTHVEDYLAPGVVKALPDGIASDREISVLVQTADSGLMQAFDAQSGISRYASVAEFAASSKGREIVSRIGRLNDDAKTRLERTGVKFTYGATYDVLVGGLEVVVKAGDYSRLAASLAGTGYTVSVSEEYEVAEAKRVENDVNVHETGIFNSEKSGYDGSGTVIAVLDTGLDYTHSAFDEKNFTSTQLTMTPESINAKISELRAAEYTPGLSAANVYYSKKVPYTYDYADHDADVYPLGDEHGTHVSGIIVGLDEEIRGVAPNAQLASMKVFSDKTAGARWSWILSALEDCIVLDVDVINMSLGSSAGFTEESDPDNMQEQLVYDSIAAHGISLVAAASNDYNSTFGSEKNGNLGLTTNPDSATVGSPGTYTSALAVASISGVKTPYLSYEGQIVYFTESADQSSETRHFVDGILPEGRNEMEFEYITVPGVGRSADYRTLKDEYDVKGKIALVRRGDNTFEDKARIAQNQGAIGVIIYNNVSGDITMTVGSVKIPVCSVSRDNGEMLAAVRKGKIKVSKDQIAGPFMSDFSSWGPTPDLRLKPEITAHGGDIYSSVPGQSYDRLSGTSMASPNQAGVTALIRQYVQKTFPNASRVAQLNYTNQIMMSTADIAKNINGLPYSVRKQGAGLANLTKATTTPAYISTYARDDDAVASQSPDRFTDEHLDKAKIEYGDDKAKTGVYKLKFDLNNISDAPLSYDVGAIVMTEGISEIKTYKGDQTVTQEGHILGDAKISVGPVTNGTAQGTVVTVGAKGMATVEVVITLGESDKQYLDQLSDRRDAQGNRLGVFENGMYVEGFITLEPQQSGGCDLSVPYLAFYGDWTQAPIFDLDYFETDKDAMDDSIATLDKTLPDAFATIPAGGFYEDYINYLGSYYFIQSPTATKITASRDHIALTNQSGEAGGANYIYGIYAGLLRSAKRTRMSVTDAVTGEVIWEKETYNERKSYNGGGSIYPASIDVGFHVTDFDLKNNTRYNFKLEAFLDYPGEQNNKRATFEFPFTVDFEAPVVTDAQFYTEYDSTTKKNRLFARLYVYDNHYTMAANIGQLVLSDDPASASRYSLDSFGEYFTPVFSELNSTSEIVVELTDYLGKLGNSVTPNTFTVGLYDYAMNAGLFEIRVPDDVKALYFKEMEHEDGTPLADGEYGVTLSPNETYVLEPVLYPANENAPYEMTSWRETLKYESDKPEVARVVNGKILAVGQGEATITAKSTAGTSAQPIMAQLTVKVLGPEEEGYEEYTKPVVDIFRLTGYTTEFAFYQLSNSDREIGLTDSETEFSLNATTYSLSMFPSERIRLHSELIAYDPDTVIVYESGNENLVTVDQEGVVTAVAQGTASVTVRVMTVAEDGTQSGTLYDRTVMVSIKDPYERNGPYLSAYRGGGMQSYTDENGVEHPHAVVIPEEMGFTQIYEFAFSGYEYIPKDLSAGDVIDKEDPGYTKVWYVGDNKDVEEVVIPEGIEVIGNYAFAGMTGLKRVVLPTTLNKIGMGAFYGCTSLQEVVGLEYVKFINQDAFFGPAKMGGYEAAPLEKVGENSFASIIAIGDQAFRGARFKRIVLPASAQSIGAYAFANCSLTNVTIKASKIKLGNGAFAGCTTLTSMDVNASVIPDDVFNGCTRLATVTLGRDVETIGPGAFAGAKFATFTVKAGNPNFAETTDKSYLLEKGGEKLLYVAPALKEFTLDTAEVGGQTVEVTTIGAGAFSSCADIASVHMPNVTKVEDNAFYGCADLTDIRLAPLEAIGSYAFAGTSIVALPEFATTLDRIGSYAFAFTALETLDIQGRSEERFTIGEGAFYGTELTSVTLGDKITVEPGAFQGLAGQIEVELGTADAGDGVTATTYYTMIASLSDLESVTIGADAEIGEMAFAYNIYLTDLTVGEGSIIGDRAFYGCSYFQFSYTDDGIGIGASVLTADLSKVKEVGEEAFSGPEATFYRVYSNGTITDPDEAGWWQAPQMTTLNLDAIEKLGVGAFAYNRYLGEDGGTFTIGDKLTEIPALAFAGETAPDFDLKNVTKIGAGAFADSFLENLTGLEDVDEIGAAAFAGSLLTEVTLKEGVRIGDEAFYGATELVSAANINKAATIGARAFADTKLNGELDLAATEIGDFAFMGTDIEKVSFPDGLQKLGEDPFAACEQLSPFVKTEPEMFHGQQVGEKSITSFVINADAGIEVIDGVLYKRTPAGGRVLVSYPAKIETREFVAADGTVRISAYAFAYNKHLFSVTLPSTLLALGDKAFYQCDGLGIVTFTSYNAPILEESYDLSYTDLPLIDENGEEIEEPDGRYASNLPSQPGFDLFTGDVEISDLGILKFRTLNFDAPNFFFGANFKDYIGKWDGDLIMVHPTNGVGYDSFTLGQYFGSTIKGAAAADATTLAAIAAIEALPQTITLAVKDQVIAARNAYDLIALDEQRAIVFNGGWYDKLKSAENTIDFLEGNGNTPVGPETPADEKPDALIITLSVLVGVFGAAAIVAFVLLILSRRTGKAPDGGADTEEAKAEDAEAAEAEAEGEDRADTADGSSEDALFFGDLPRDELPEERDDSTFNDR